MDIVSVIIDFFLRVTALCTMAKNCKIHAAIAVERFGTEFN